MTKWSYNRKERRAFHRPISGLIRAKGKMEKVRLMILTSSPQIGMIIISKRYQRHPFLSEILSAQASSSEDDHSLLSFLHEEGMIKLNFKKLNYHFNLLLKQIEYTFGFKKKYWKVCTNEG